MRFAVFLFIAWGLISCSTEKTSPTNTVLTDLQYGCFGFSGDGKTITLQVTETGRQIKGNLSYDIVGKAPIAGTFEGVLEEDILIGTYTYRLRGMESTRGIAFKVDENGLREGHGILNADGSTFENPQYLNFTASRQLRLKDCQSGVMTVDLQHDNVYSQVQFALFDPNQDGIPLHPISNNNSLAQEKPAYLLFNEDQTKAEIFFTNQRNSLVLKKTHEGNWTNSQYTLSNWKGFTLYHEITPIFVSEKQSEKTIKNPSTFETLSEAR